MALLTSKLDENATDLADFEVVSQENIPLSILEEEEEVSTKVLFTVAELAQRHNMTVNGMLKQLKRLKIPPVIPGAGRNGAKYSEYQLLLILEEEEEVSTKARKEARVLKDLDKWDCEQRHKALVELLKDMSDNKELTQEVMREIMAIGHWEVRGAVQKSLDVTQMASAQTELRKLQIEYNDFKQLNDKRYEELDLAVDELQHGALLDYETAWDLGYNYAATECEICERYFVTREENRQAWQRDQERRARAKKNSLDNALTQAAIQRVRG